MPPCFVAQAIILKALQKELSGLPSALALAPMGMAVITLMIVVLHIIVNAEDISVSMPSLNSIFLRIKDWWHSRKD